MGCPRCGQPYPSDALECPHCGLERSLLPSRIRCRQCGRRIRADSVVCPRCGRDPYSKAPPSLRVPLFLVGGLLLICSLWVMYRAVTTNTLDRALAWINPAPSSTPTARIAYAVATTRAPLPTLTPTATPTLTPLHSPTPTLSPTPTRRGAPTITSTPPPPTMTPVLYPNAPQLMAPTEGAAFSGPGAAISLEWQPIANRGLYENEWYAISISFTASDNSLVTRTGWSKEPNWHVPPDWWNDLSPNTRVVSWNVTVVRIEGADPFASPSRLPSSPTSVTRSFTWK